MKANRRPARFTITWGDYSKTLLCADEAHAVALGAAECQPGEVFGIETPRGAVKFFITGALGNTPISASRAALEVWMHSTKEGAKS